MADVNSSLVYTRHTSPGVALIIVNEKYLKSGRRYGAYKDFQGLTDTFRRLGFKIVALYDATDKEILAVMRTVSAMDHNGHTNFVMVVSSHGHRRKGSTMHWQCDSIFGVNEGMLDIDTLIEHFSETQCPSLKGKPKLFFIQACRGAQMSETATADIDTTEMPSISSNNNFDDNTKTDVDAIAYQYHGLNSEDVPLRRDCLLACSSPPGFVAFGDENGSWFIQKLCQVLLEQHGERDLESMLTEINHRVATEYTSNMPEDEKYRKYHDRRTMPWVASMLIKQVRL